MVCQGDAIVAIADVVLLGLDEEQLDAEFGRAFVDKAQLLVGPFVALQDT